MKKVFFLIFAAAMLFCSCGKEDSENSAAEQVKTPVFGYIAFEELGEEAFSDMEHVLSVIEKGPYPDADYIYLYVIDEAGRPVMNIQCFNPEQWAEYLENGISKGRALSMPGGLLPIKIPSYFSEEKLWEGEFLPPLGDSWYRETTSYGTFRTFSSGRTEWHNATDMAVGGGTPIFATNSGKVLFADWLGLTGNTIIIDHGCGVMSWHYHLHKINVAEGDFIEKNTKIGLVGTTGLSTGNHLHFGITVGGVFVDPMGMIGTEPELDFEKVKTE